MISILLSSWNSILFILVVAGMSTVSPCCRGVSCLFWSMNTAFPAIQMYM